MRVPGAISSPRPHLTISFRDIHIPYASLTLLSPCQAIFLSCARLINLTHLIPISTMIENGINKKGT